MSTGIPMYPGRSGATIAWVFNAGTTPEFAT